MEWFGWLYYIHDKFKSYFYLLFIFINPKGKFIYVYLFTPWKEFWDDMEYI
jgi:hypothetical protein